MPKYLHCSMAGSYYIDCEIIKENAPYTKEYWNPWEGLLNNPEPIIGTVIKYHDFVIDEVVFEWVPSDRVVVQMK